MGKAGGSMPVKEVNVSFNCVFLVLLMHLVCEPDRLLSTGVIAASMDGAGNLADGGASP